MNNSKVILQWGAVVVLLGGLLYGTYLLGQRQSHQVTWLSELVERTSGRKAYLIDGPVVCSNGKHLGTLQVDVNLRNGKVRVVRNDAGLDPDCTYVPQLPPPIQAPAPPSATAAPPVVPPPSTTAPPVSPATTAPTKK